MRRWLWAAWAVVVAWTCAPRVTSPFDGGGSARDLSVLVASDYWDATAVRLFCDTGRELGAVRGLVWGGQRHRSFRLQGCQTVYFMVDVIGRRRAWRSPDRFLVAPGECLDVRLGADLNLTTARVRARC